MSRSKNSDLDAALDDILGNNVQAFAESWTDPKEYGIVTSRAEFMKGATMPTGVYDRAAARARREAQQSVPARSEPSGNGIHSNGDESHTQSTGIIAVLKAERARLGVQIEILNRTIADLEKAGA